MVALVTTHRRDPKQILAAEAGTTILVPLGHGRYRLLEPREAMSRGEARGLRTTNYHAVVHTGPRGSVEVPVRVDLAIGTSEDGEAVVDVHYSSHVPDVAALVESWRPQEDADEPVRTAVLAHVQRACGRFARGAIPEVEQLLLTRGFTYRGLTVTIDSCLIRLSPASADRVYADERAEHEHRLARREADARRAAERDHQRHKDELSRLADMAQGEREKYLERTIPGWAQIPPLYRIRLMRSDLSPDAIAEVLREVREAEQINRQQALAEAEVLHRMGVLQPGHIDAIANGFGSSAAIAPPRPAAALGASPAEEAAADDDAVTGDVIDVAPGSPLDGPTRPPATSPDDVLEQEFQRFDGTSTTPEGDETANDEAGDHEEDDLRPLSLQADDL